MSEKRPSNPNASITPKRAWKGIIVHIKLDKACFHYNCGLKQIHRNTYKMEKQSSCYGIS
jgi:hypothetical protein